MTTHGPGEAACPTRPRWAQPGCLPTHDGAPGVQSGSVGACRAGVMPGLRPDGQGGGRGQGRPHTSMERRAPRGLAPTPLLTQHSCRRKLCGRMRRPTAWAPRPVPREFTPACSPVLEMTERSRRSGASGPRAMTSQPRGAEPSRCQRAGGGACGRTPSGRPHALGRAQQGAWPRPAAAQDHTPHRSRGGQMRAQCWEEMGWSLGLWAGQGSPSRDQKPLPA